MEKGINTKANQHSGENTQKKSHIKDLKYPRAIIPVYFC